MQTTSPRSSHDRAFEAVSAAGAGLETWTNASRHACDVVGADAAAFIVWKVPEMTVTIMEGHGHDARLVQDYEAHFHRHDLLLSSARFCNEWQVSDETFPAAQWGRHEFFGGFLERHRVRQVLALTLKLGSDYLAGFSFHRHTRQHTTAAELLEGPVGAFTRHVVEAFGIREAAARASRTSLHQLLATDKTVCFLADSQARIDDLIGFGSSLDRLRCFGLLGEGRTLRHRQPASQTRLLKALRTAMQGGSAKVCLSSPGHLAVRVQFHPAPPAAKQGITQPLALVQVTVIDGDDKPSPEDLRSLYALTAAEVRVLLLLCEGESVAQCAARLECSVATIKTHLHHLFAKMYCSRQSQLVRTAMLVR